MGAMKIIEWISLAQFCFFVLGFFINRASETFPRWYLKCMPEICFGSIWISTIALPFVIMLIILWVLITENFSETLCYYCLVQVGTIIWVILRFREPFSDSYDKDCLTRDGVLVLHQRAKQRGVLRWTTSHV